MTSISFCAYLFVGPSKAFDGTVRYRNIDWLLVEAIADGSCMAHATFQDPLCVAYCKPKNIVDGFELRLHIIAQMQEHHSAAFRTICNALAPCLKGGLTDTALHEFVENSLKKRGVYLQLDFALMMSLVMRVDFILVSNTSPVVIRSASEHARKLKIAFPSDIHGTIQLAHYRFNRFGDTLNFNRFNHYALMLNAVLHPEIVDARKKRFEAKESSTRPLIVGTTTEAKSSVVGPSSF